MSLNKHVIITLILLLAALFTFETGNIDISIQDMFYNQSNHSWLINNKDLLLKTLFYTGPKTVLVISGVLCFAGWIFLGNKIHFEKYKRFFILMSLSLAIVPLLISSIKNISNVYTPAQITRYNGNKPYVKVFEKYPGTFMQKSRGKGWPAGHASGGFAVMMLYFALERKKIKIIGLIAGLSIGWIMGLYQMFKGAHFLSHTVVTMLLAWILILLICKFAEISGIRQKDTTHKPVCN